MVLVPWHQGVLGPTYCTDVLHMCIMAMGHLTILYILMGQMLVQLCWHQMIGPAKLLSRSMFCCYHGDPAKVMSWLLVSQSQWQNGKPKQEIKVETVTEKHAGLSSHTSIHFSANGWHVLWLFLGISYCKLWSGFIKTFETLCHQHIINAQKRNLMINTQSKCWQWYAIDTNVYFGFVFLKWLCDQKPDGCKIMLDVNFLLSWNMYARLFIHRIQCVIQGMKQGSSTTLKSKQSKMQKSYLKIDSPCYKCLHSKYATVQMSLVCMENLLLNTQVIAPWLISGLEIRQNEAVQIYK